jgi:hypothetical protein
LRRHSPFYSNCGDLSIPISEPRASRAKEERI